LFVLATLTFGQTVALGAIAGITIFIGLPAGRLTAFKGRGRIALSMFSVGILLFIFLDVGSHGEQIVETALEAFKHHHAGFGRVAVDFLLLAVGFLLGSVGITVAERRLRALQLPRIAGGSQPVAVAAIPPQASPERQRLRTAMTVACAIGLHNFAEGLAIGVSAASGAVALATVLVIGFAAHNATEGFAIVGPLGESRPSRRWLIMAGLVGGGPTFLGTLVGYQFNSEPLELLFYALAAGALVYVIGEIWAAMRRFGHPRLALLALSAGFLLGVLTDLIVTYGGG